MRTSWFQWSALAPTARAIGKPKTPVLVSCYSSPRPSMSQSHCQNRNIEATASSQFYYLPNKNVRAVLLFTSTRSVPNENGDQKAPCHILKVGRWLAESWILPNLLANQKRPKRLCPYMVIPCPGTVLTRVLMIWRHESKYAHSAKYQMNHPSTE